MSNPKFPALATIASGIDALRATLAAGDLPVNSLRTLLAAANNEEANGVTISRAAGVTQPSGCRALATWGEGLSGRPGRGLVDMATNPQRKSEKLARLTTAGRHAVRRAEEAVAAALRGTERKAP